MNDSPIQDCDKCRGKGTLKRLITGGTGMVFKGSGFYLTDYTDYGKKAEKKTEKKSSKKNKKNKDTKRNENL